MTLPAMKQTLGWVWILWSGVSVLVGASVGGLFVFLAAMMLVIPNQQGDAPPAWLAVVFAALGGGIGMIFVALGGLGMAAGWFYQKGHGWARIALLVMALMQATQFPVGTLLMLGTFWVLYREAAATEGKA